jgi:hypothetical protein
LLSKLFPDVSTTVTDYPDEALIGTLTSNVRRNDVALNCRVVPYAWGSDPSPLLGADGDGFDIIIAADTLWNSELHHILIDSLTKTLKRTSSSRIHLIAGLHTGRYTIQAAITCAERMDLEIESILEREVDGSSQRPWCVYREGEDEQARRRWVVWIKLKWASPTPASSTAQDSESHVRENNYEQVRNVHHHFKSNYVTKNSTLLVKYAARRAHNNTVTMIHWCSIKRDEETSGGGTIVHGEEVQSPLMSILFDNEVGEYLL